MRMGFLEWLGFETRSETPEAPVQGSGVIPPSRADFSTDAAYGLTGVYRAISLLTIGVSQLTLDVWRGEDPIDPKPGLVRRPDPNGSLSAFLESTVSSLAASGNAYWWVERNQRGEAVSARVLDPWLCVVDQDGVHYNGKVHGRDRIQHLALLRLPGRYMGLGPIQACRKDLEAARDARDYGNAFLNGSEIPSGVLSTDQMLTKEQSAQWQAQWAQREPHRTAVLGNGLTYEPTLLSPKDAQFIESQQFTTTGIARLFGIPAHLFLAVVEGGSQTYANIGQADLSFVRWTLSQYTREIEEAFTLLLPGTQAARFNFDALLRLDTLSRYQAHEIGLRAEFLDVEEVRRIERLPARTRPAPVEGENE